MFCPECKSEYKEGIAVCADCQVSLVADLPPDRPHEEFTWIPLYELSSQIYAEMAKEALAEEKVPSYIKADFLTTAYGIKGGSLPGARATLYVPQEYVEKAKSILANIVGEE